MRLVIVAMILGIGGGGYYLAKRGFGRQWRYRVVEELRKHGVELRETIGLRIAGCGLRIGLRIADWIADWGFGLTIGNEAMNGCRDTCNPQSNPQSAIRNPQ
jgi:hypothetical protein